MRALKFHTIFVKDKYQMAVMCNVVHLPWLCIEIMDIKKIRAMFYKHVLYYINNNKEWQDTKWPPFVRKIVCIDTKTQFKKTYQRLWYQLKLTVKGFYINT